MSNLHSLSLCPSLTGGDSFQVSKITPTAALPPCTQLMIDAEETSGRSRTKASTAEEAAVEQKESEDAAVPTFGTAKAARMASARKAPPRSRRTRSLLAAPPAAWAAPRSIRGGGASTSTGWATCGARSWCGAIAALPKGASAAILRPGRPTPRRFRSTAASPICPRATRARAARATYADRGPSNPRRIGSRGRGTSPILAGDS